VTDLDLVLKRLAFIDACLVELRTLSRPEALETDVKERRFVEHTLQVCLQAVQDVASHIVADQRLGEPSTNQQLFRLLHTAGWLDAPLSDALRAAIGFRNVLVHGYTAVDLNIVRDVLAHHLDDVATFVSVVRARLSTPA
jgi:uncharacterized protein YutE (UPF0331/DUF86 family)